MDTLLLILYQTICLDTFISLFKISLDMFAFFHSVLHMLIKINVLYILTIKIT